MDVIEYQRRINEFIMQRERLDIKAVYARLKDIYDLMLTHAFALEDGEKDYDEDYEMLCGVSSAGKFQLYDDGLYVVFDVVKADGKYAHWHPLDIDEAIEAVQSFMEGNCKC